MVFRNRRGVIGKWDGGGGNVIVLRSTNVTIKFD